jgi:hypothetical protein
VDHIRLRQYVQSLTIGIEWLDTLPPSPERFTFEFVRNHTSPVTRGTVSPRLFTFQKHPFEISWTEFTRATINKFRKKFDRGILNNFDAIGWSLERLFNAYKLCGNMLWNSAL